MTNDSLYRFNQDNPLHFVGLQLFLTLNPFANPVDFTHITPGERALWYQAATAGIDALNREYVGQGDIRSKMVSEALTALVMKHGVSKGDVENAG